MRLCWTNFSFVSGYQIERASWLEMGACVHFSSQCWNPIWLRTGVYTAKSLWVHMYGNPVFRRSCSPGLLHPLWLLQFSHLLFYRISGGLWGEEMDGNIPSMIYKWVLCFQILEKVWRTMNFMANGNYMKFMFPCSWSYVGSQPHSVYCQCVCVASRGFCLLKTELNNHGREYSCAICCAELALLTMSLPLE